MSKKVRIHVIGKDDWALGTEFRLACECLATFAEIMDCPDQADFLHTVDVEDTASRIYCGRLVPVVPVVGAVNNHPTRLVEWPGFVDTATRFMYLVPQSTIAAEDMDRLGLWYPGRSRMVTDSASYHVIDGDDLEQRNLRRQLGVPDDRYVIGLLQRDSEGRDLTIPKRQKGPDIFLALMMLLKKQVGGDKFHVLLGGPRRHWIRAALDRAAIPYTFVGRDIAGDDYPLNILDKETMCRLYNMLDLYVIPTRWEGAPRQVFDMLECGRKIISTPVGIAPDILPQECIFHSLTQGVECIVRDMESGFLEPFIEPCRTTVRDRHSVESVGLEWKRIYRKILEKETARKYSPPERTIRRSVPLYLKPLSFLLDKTRIGRLQKEYFPRKLAMMTHSEGRARLLEQFGDRLRKQGVRLMPDSRDAKTLLVWPEPESVSERSARCDGKRLILVLDESCCMGLLHRDQGQVREYSLLRQAETTVVTHDMDLGLLNKAGIMINNPVVVRLPPDPSVFRSGTSVPQLDSHEPKCLIFFDSTIEWNMEWRRACDRTTGVSLTFFDMAHFEWLLQADKERAEPARAHDFAVVLSNRMDRDGVYELLACGLPCLYASNLEDIRPLVGMAGFGVDDAQSLIDGIEHLRDAFACFAAAITLPSLDEATLTLADIVNTSFRGYQ